MKKCNKLTTILGGLSILPMSLAAVTSCNTASGPSVTTYTVTFDLDGGTIAGMSGNTMKVLQGTTYGQLPSPSKENSLFSYWSKDGTEVQSDVKITSNVKIKANYSSFTPGLQVIEPTEESERTAEDYTKLYNSQPSYYFTIPGEFTISDEISNEDSIKWAATITGTAKNPDGTEEQHSVCVTDGWATKTKDNTYQLSTWYLCSSYTDGDNFNNSNFLIGMMPNTYLTVSDFWITDISSGKAYKCTETYKFKILPQLMFDYFTMYKTDYRYTALSTVRFTKYWPINMLSTTDGAGSLKLSYDSSTQLSHTVDAPIPNLSSTNLITSVQRESAVYACFTYDTSNPPTVGSYIKVGYELLDKDGSTILYQKDLSSENPMYAYVSN